MCGLAGLVSADPACAPGPDPGGDVSVMLAALAHRGPDGEGLKVLPGAALGHRRLSIIDLSSKGAQPMPSGCAERTGREPRHWIVLNGEIYNNIELRAELVGRGHTFASGTDTEVILHLYEEMGDACVNSLRGMFAFAVWDVAEKRLLLARDRLGEKPLYYRIEKDRIVFASELQALVALARRRGQRVETDPAALRRYLALKYVPGPDTAVAGIHKVPPASVLAYENGRARISSYWSLPEAVEEPVPDTERLVAQLRSTVAEATSLRLRSDVPVGLFLSGGLDSAIIAAEMTALARAGAFAGPILTFTVGFPQPDYDETRGAAEVAEALGTRHHAIRISPTPGQTADLLPLLARRMDQPFADSSALAVHHLAREVRAHVTVALSGDGGDELFLGYDRYRAHDIAERRSSSLALTAPAVRLMRGLVRTALPGAPGRRNLAGRATRFLDAAALPALDRNDLWITCIDPALAAAVAPGLANAVDPLDAIREAYGPTGARPPMAAIQRADCLVYLPDDILHKVDSGCMAHGLEPRAPFLDHRVVELAMRIPRSLKLRRGRGKAILREAYARELPAGALARRKAGFGLPLDHWLRGELAGYCRDVLLDGRTLSRGLYSRGGIETMLDDHVGGRANREEAIWTLLMLEHWHRAVLESGTTT